VDTIQDHLGISPQFPLLGAPRSGTPPSATLHRGVWLLVCLAAHQAMDFGRRSITALRLTSSYSDGPTATSLVAGNAVLHFWEHLHFCARSSRLPLSWRSLNIDAQCRVFEMGSPS